MLGNRLRRWPNIKQTEGDSLLFSGMERCFHLTQLNSTWFYIPWSDQSVLLHPSKHKPFG